VWEERFLAIGALLRHTCSMPDTALSPFTPAARALFARGPDSASFNRLRKRLARQAQNAIETYGMERPGARWLVCLSGGKDSYALLAILLDLKAQGRIGADLLACNLDQAQPGFPDHILPEYLKKLGVPYRIERRDTYSIVKDKVPEGQTYCALCSRLRRGHLYRIAREEGCSGIVLGHHRDDALETLMLNMAFGGKLAAMPPKLLNDAGDVTVLRPLITSAENDLARYTTALNCPIIPCDLCGSQDGLQRQQMKARLDTWEKDVPGLRETMARALANVNAGHLMDGDLFDFAGLAPQGDDPSLP